MSHHQWPVAIAAFAIMGWVSQAAAQRANGTSRGDAQVSLGFEEPDIPAAETSSPIGGRWRTGDLEQTAETQRFSNPRGAALDSDQGGRFGSSGSGPRQSPEPRVAQLQGIDFGNDGRTENAADDTPLRINTPESNRPPPSSWSPGRRDYHDLPGGSANPQRGNRKFATGRTRTEPILGEAPPMPAAVISDATQSGIENNPSAQTRITSLGSTTGLEEVANSTPANGESTSADPTSSESRNGDVGQDSVAVKSVYLLPLMMGLFASLAANLFFGWVAWDAHARYQDLVDDMTESDSRQTRPSRRVRGNEPSAYRPRERALEEAELLSGGMEPTHG